MRNGASFSDLSAPSGPNSAEPRPDKAPASMTRLLTCTPSAAGFSSKVALPGRPAGFHGGPPSEFERRPGEIDLDRGAALVERRFQLQRDRPPEARAGIEAELGARRLVEIAREQQRAHVLADLGHVKLGRGAEDDAGARHLEFGAVGGDVERGLLQFRVAEEFVDRQPVETAGDAEFLLLRLHALAERQVELEIALELALDRIGIERDADIAFERVAHQQVGQRVGPADDMAGALSRHARDRLGVRHGEGEARPSEPPPVAEVHRPARRFGVEIAAGDDAGRVEVVGRGQSRQQVHRRAAQRETAVDAVGRRRLPGEDGGEGGGVPMDLERAGGELAALDVLHAPCARVRIDEGRPEPQHLQERARAFEVERQLRPRRAHMQARAEYAVQMRPARGELVGCESRRRPVEMGVEIDVVQNGGRVLLARGRDQNIAAVQMQPPRRVGGRRRGEPAAEAHMRRPGEDLDLVQGVASLVVQRGLAGGLVDGDGRPAVGSVGIEPAGADARSRRRGR